ncbi:MAG: DinB family protein [Chlorobi bacterium]|nr:DinB family protein [Chlorobiota bacterium]MCI0715313.1 DinB family protein [Chlorobiota bacterium]
MTTLKKQYELIKSSREVVLNYCETIRSEDLTKQIENFNKNSICYLLLHIANTYIFWLKRFAENEGMKYFKVENAKDVNDIRKAFDEVNIIVENFLNKHTDFSTPIEGEIFWLKKNMTYTVLELFTHVITHEFHHKGQIMTMSRILGCTPPDADVIRF